MAKKKSSRVRSVPLKSSTSGRVRTIAAPRAGQPRETLTTRTFPVIPKPVFAKSKIKTLIKRDVSKGITMPEAANMALESGVVTGDKGGFKGARIVRQHPVVPVLTGKGKRVVTPPSPTSGAGVRSPYNAKTKVGKTAKSTRYRGKRMK